MLSFTDHTIAADKFVESYYALLNKPAKDRGTLASFYIRATASSPVEADISLNGNIIADATQLQSIYQTQIGRSHHDVGSYDFQVLNTNYNVGLDESKFGPAPDGSKISLIVMVSGSVEYFKDDKEGEKRGFVDNVVLVPNWEAQNPKAPKGVKKFLIQSQVFRLVT